ncbi:MAG TPA: hypothetical protein VK454_10275 [Myxococcaceae bacterium]|nr:hypothetical protein [Myxococcaceae bacterium]
MAPDRLAVFWFLLLAGCASSTKATTPAAALTHGWHPVPPVELADRCQAEAAQRCYQEGMQALGAQPPDAFMAQNLLAAACEGGVAEACGVLERRFRAPTPVAVPSLAQYVPPSGYAVVQYTCRVSTAGALVGCRRTRSSGSTPKFDATLDASFKETEASGHYQPATVDGVAYETEVRLNYVLKSATPPSLGGATQAVPDRPADVTADQHSQGNRM